jgi:tetratricopeptide (TPR) repeat protein
VLDGHPKPGRRPGLAPRGVAVGLGADTFHLRRGHLHDRLTAWQMGLAAAQDGDDPSGGILAHRRLGQAYADVGGHADALAHLGHALDVARGTSNLLAQAHTHRALAVAWERQGKDQQALEHATSALHLFQALDHPVWEAETLNSVGWFSARLGYYQQARTHCQAALTLCQRHQHRVGEAGTLDSLGYLAHHTGQHHQALDYYQQALILYRDLGDTYRRVQKQIDELTESQGTQMEVSGEEEGS